MNSPVSSSRRRWLGALSALLLGVLAAEFLVRRFARDEVDTARLAERVAEFKLGDLKRFSSDPELYFELKPGLDILQQNVRIVTDGDGCRIPERPIEHLPGLDGDAVRVALVGPSTAFGWRIPYEKTYGELVRRRLEETWRRPVELRNFGVPAYNSTQEARLFELKVLPWRPRLVLWNYDHRDAYPMILPMDSIGLPPEFGDNLLHSALLKLACRRVREWQLDRKRFQGDPYTEYGNYLTSGPAWDEHLAALERVSRHAVESRTPVVLFINDAILQRMPQDAGHFEKLHRPLLDRLHRLPEFRVLDLLPRFQELMIERDWKNLEHFWMSTTPRDGHPNVEGHAFLADELVRFLAAMPDLPGR